MRALLAAMAAALSVVACDSAPRLDDMTVHESARFTIAAPSDWAVEKDRYDIPLSLQPPESLSGMAHVTVAIDANNPRLPDEASEPDLARYASLKLERSGYLTAPSSVEARESGTLNGEAVVRAVRSYRAGPVDFRAHHYFLLAPNGDGFSVTAAAPEGDFAALAPYFEAVLESFQLQ